MNKIPKKVVIVTNIMIVIAAVSLSVFSLNYKTSAVANPCSNSKGIVHEVAINNSYASPQITEGHLCEKITFTNYDNIIRDMAFGPHEHHVAYDGITEKVLGVKQSFTITLVKTGTFDFHDHLNDTVIGNFIVTN